MVRKLKIHPSTAELLRLMEPQQCWHCPATLSLKLGCTRQNIYLKMIRLMTLGLVERKGERNYYCYRLTPLYSPERISVSPFYALTVPTLRNLLAATPLADLAKTYGVSPSTLRKYRQQFHIQAYTRFRSPVRSQIVGFLTQHPDVWWPFPSIARVVPARERVIYRHLNSLFKQGLVLRQGIRPALWAINSRP